MAAMVPQHAIGAPLMVTCAVTVGVTAGHTDVSLWYVVQGERGETLDIETTEFNSARWFAFQDVPLDRSDPSSSRFIAKLKGAAGGRT